MEPVESDNPPLVDHRARMSDHVRQSNCEVARRHGNNNQLWASAQSLCSSINSRFYSEPATAQQQANFAQGLEWDMHDLWHIFYQASSNISEDHPAADKLALHIIQMREQGLLARNQLKATTSDGDLWTDLPFFVYDMAGYWTQDHAAMSSAQRLSFAKFLAKLAAAGVGKGDGLCTHVALSTLRQGLETPRPLGTSADHQQVEDGSRREAELSVAAFLPSVNAWLRWAGLKLIQLCEAEQGEEGLGSLVGSTGGSHDVAPFGFSISRWMFWLTRLESLAASYRDADEESLAAFATGMMDNMLLIVEGTGGPLRRELAAAYLRGEVQHHPGSGPHGRH